VATTSIAGTAPVSSTTTDTVPGSNYSLITPPELHQITPSQVGEVTPSQVVQPPRANTGQLV
jgi:hypothetical protein